MEAKHTPTPWRAQNYNPQRMHTGLFGSDDKLITYFLITPSKADEQFMLRACNSHSALVEALKACAGVLSGEGMSKSSLVDALEKTLAALALAGETP